MVNAKESSSSTQSQGPPQTPLKTQHTNFEKKKKIATTCSLYECIQSV